MPPLALVPNAVPAIPLFFGLTPRTGCETMLGGFALPSQPENCSVLPPGPLRVSRWEHGFFDLTDVAAVADGRTPVWVYDTIPLHGQAGTLASTCSFALAGAVAFAPRRRTVPWFSEFAVGPDAGLRVHAPEQAII